ncbi:MAG: hypothetical protein M3M93_01410 [Actinomycetota bacterium]|nr:hypothetical protein [Actinomycetota bacterium]
MSLLRRVLGVGAVVTLVLSAPLVVIPRTIVESLMEQAPVADDVWIRLFGTAGIALALFHVLILRKLDDLWWWVWAFVIFDGLSSVIVIAHASVGVPEGSSGWPWWAYGAISVLFTALYLVGLAKAGQERPFA